MAEAMTNEQEQAMLQELSMAGISDEEFLSDMEDMAVAFSNLEDVQDNVEGLPPKDQNILRGEALVDVVNALAKYDNLPLLQKYIIEAIDDTLGLEEFNKILDDMETTSAGIDISEYDADLEEIKILYERTRNMDGLSDEAKLENYDAVLDAVKNLTFAMGPSEDAEVLQEQFARYLGMPEDIFPDRMAEYTQLKATQIGDILQEADDYTRADARDALLKRGNDAPTDQEISEHYLDHKLALYQEAQGLDAEFNGNIMVSDTMHGRLEYLGGYTVDSIDLQIEVVELELEQLEMQSERMESTKSAALEQAVDVSSDQAVQPYQPNVQNSSAPGI